METERASTTPEVQQTPQPSFNLDSPATAPKPSKRWLFPSIIVLVVVLAIALVFIRQKPATTPLPSTTQVPQTLTGLEIATQTAKFLDSTASSSGNFHKAYNCSNSTKSSIKCIAQPETISNVSNRNQGVPTDLSEYNGLIARAYIDLFNKTSNKVYRLAAQNTLAFVTSKCNPHIIYCANSLPGLYAWYKLTNDSNYKQLITDAEVTLLKKTSVEEDVIGQKGEYYWLLYDATQDPKVKDYVVADAKAIMGGNLDKSKFTGNLGLVYKDGNLEVDGSGIVAQEWLIAAYQITKDQTYLNAAQQFFDQAKIGSHVSDFVQTGNGLLALNATEYLLNLADVSTGAKQQDYLNQAETLTQAAVLYLWDNPTNKKFDGDYGFLQNFTGGDIGNTKVTFQNAFRIRQLLRLSDKTFNLK